MTSNPRPLAAVVVHYFGGDALHRCLQSLQGSTRVPDRVVVIDNGSDAGWRGEIAAAFPRVEVQSLPGNLGFAGALPGRVAELASDGSLLILNQDCELDRECLARLEAVLDHDRVAIACPTILDRSGRIWAQGGRLDLLTGRNRNLAVGEAPDEREGSPFTVGFAPGAAMLVRADAWRAAGGMDARFFMYFEDADLAARMQRAGYQIVCEPRAVCRHDGSSASGSEYERFQSYFRLRNRALFVERNSSWFARTLFALAVLPALLVRDVFRYEVRGRRSAYREVLRGLRDIHRTPNPPTPDARMQGPAENHLSAPSGRRSPS